ncbi:SLC13 family permease [Lachnospiraceae bacterium OttesenSCG-928-D06]|nr:SLC13 family permease [Lachnospiraceae bacterium OttesenSCG-928-D06]
MTQSTLSLIILCVIIILFVTRLIPLGITAVLGAITMAVFGIISFGEAFSAFSSDTVLLILGMIVVGNALTETGFTDIIGRKMMKIPAVGTSEKQFLIIVMAVAAIISGFISNTATIAIFLPLLSSMARVKDSKITKKNTYMAVGIASVLGGNLTLAGSTPQMVAQGILSQTKDCEPMGFFDLTKVAILLIVVMLIYFSAFGYRLQKKVFTFEEKDCQLQETRVEVRKDKAIICGFVFLFCIVGFVFNIFTLGTVAIIAACICIITGCITLEKAAATMDWTSILVLGGSMGFSKALDQSGALQNIADFIIQILGHAATPYVMLAVFLILASLMSNVMSNTATTAILVPIAIAVARGLDCNPTLFAIVVVVGSSLAVATPISTPPITMTLSGGYRFVDYVIVGGILNVICIIAALFILPFLYGF